MKIWGIIPARFGSTRFPGKPLKVLKDKPIIQWVIELCQKSGVLDEVVVATENKDIYDFVTKIKAKVVMTSEDCVSGSDRIFEALQIIKKDQVVSDDDIVINIQGDEPLLPTDYIENLVSVLKNEKQIEMATLAHHLDEADIENKNAVKVIINQNNEAIYFSRYPIPYSREKYFLSDYVKKHIGLYGYKTSFLERFCKSPQAEIEKAESLEQLRALHLGAKIKVLTVAQSTQGVDTPEDLQRIEKMLGA